VRALLLAVGTLQICNHELYDERLLHDGVIHVLLNGGFDLDAP